MFACLSAIVILTMLFGLPLSLASPFMTALWIFQIFTSSGIRLRVRIGAVVYLAALATVSFVVRGFVGASEAYWAVLVPIELHILISLATVIIALQNGKPDPGSW